MQSQYCSDHIGVKNVELAFLTNLIVRCGRFEAIILDFGLSKHVVYKTLEPWVCITI